MKLILLVLAGVAALIGLKIVGTWWAYRILGSEEA